MSDFKLTASAVAIVVSTLKAEHAQAKRWVACSDVLRAEGVTAELMKDDADWRLAFIEAAVMPSFTKTEQDIFAKKTATLSDEQKITKRYVTTERASRYSKVARYVLRAEQEEEMSDAERGARAATALEDMLRKTLSALVVKVQKAERVSFSASEMVKALQGALTILK